MKQHIFKIIILCFTLFFSIPPAHAATDWKPLPGLTQNSGADTVNVRADALNDSALILEYALPTPQFVADGDAELLVAGNAPLEGDPGEPLLPVIPATIALPAGHTLGSVQATLGTRIDLPGTHTLQHAQESFPLMDSFTPSDTAQDAGIYLSDAAYPADRYEVVGVQRGCGVALGIIKLHPVIYKPASGQVSYYETITLTIETEPAPNLNDQVRYRASRWSDMANTVDNPETLASYSENTDNLDASGICDPSDDYRYVLVTSQAIKDANTDPTVHDLIAHRKSQGMTAVIVTIEDILAEYDGVDNAEKLRNFIIDAYNNWGTDFVLLGGDTNVLPYRALRADAGFTKDNLPSDLYFQCLDGSFNEDGDNLWGEPEDGPDGKDVDLFSEVYIGRASAEDAEEMSNFVYKTLRFETQPADYQKNVLLVAELLWSSSNTYGKPYMEEIRLGASTHGYTTKGFAQDPSYIVDILYDKDAEWSKSDIIAKLNTDAYGIVNHLGHSNYDYVMRFYNSDVAKLTNKNPFFAYSQGCIPGNFEKDCIAERLTTSSRTGAVAVVYNSRYGFGKHKSTDGGSQRYNREFWDAYFGEGLRHLGAMNADSHEDNAWRIDEKYMRWCYYESNLLGDPATQLGGGGTEKRQTFVIANKGEADLTVANLSVTGTSAADFALKNDGCSGKTVAPGGQCAVDVVFDPSEKGEKTAFLSIPSNDPDTPDQTISLTGTAEGIEFGTVTGRLATTVAGQETPLAGAVVRIPGTNLSAVTDANGNYTIENAPAGTRVLEASSDHFSPVSFGALVLDAPDQISNAEEILLTDARNMVDCADEVAASVEEAVLTERARWDIYGDNKKGLPEAVDALRNASKKRSIARSPVPRAAGSVAGKVVTTISGVETPVPGAAVSVVGHGALATTDASGAYALSGVPTGQQTLVAESDYFSAVQLQINVSEGANTAPDAVLTTAKDAVNCDQTVAEAVDDAVKAERSRWDADGDNQKGLADAIEDLKVVTGIP